MSDTEQTSDSASSRLSASEPEVPSPRKRKRETKPLDVLEVDISAPEPPSKKALRKAKKGKSTKTTSSSSTATGSGQVQTDGHATFGESDAEDHAPTPVKRSDFGIWIGNLPFTATKADVRKFFVENSEITEEHITRINLPPPAPTTSGPTPRVKPQNKGFAYIDFTTAKALEEALGLSEALLTGRRVLIKNSKSFEGRPEKPKEDGTAATAALKSAKPPSTRIFIGNLGFDVTSEDLKEHFARCGEVEDVHVATFEDTGNCKGYGWVSFAELEGAEAAVRGWVKIFEPTEESEDGDEKGSDEGDDGEKKAKKQKKRKWWVNRIKGRPMRMEFAEDKAVRYKKRFGKESKDRSGNASGEGRTTAEDGGNEEAAQRHEPQRNGGSGRPSAGRGGRASGPPRFERKVDARSIKPGAALANAPRLTGAIVAGKGTKTTFD